MQNLEGIEFGPLRIEKYLGMGGYAVVYRAYDTARQDVVAVKILADPWLKHQSVVDAFAQEGRLGMQMDHPNIAKVIETSRLYGIPYHVMELCNGVTLSEWISEPWPVEAGREDICGIILQLGSALDYMHRRRIVHLDVAPRNIVVDDTRSVKLIDFGLARGLLGINLGVRRAIGTPYYMAPERRRRKGVGPRTDVFSMARVAKATIVAWRDAVSLCAEKPRLGRAKELPPGLLRVIEPAESNNPRNRPSSALSFAQDLSAALVAEKWLDEQPR